LDAAKAINAMQPTVIPSAWAAVIGAPVPFRKRSSLRKLREDLLGIGAVADQLPEPVWLTDEVAANT
jgi:hypothetical protein